MEFKDEKMHVEDSGSGWLSWKFGLTEFPITHPTSGNHVRRILTTETCLNLPLLGVNFDFELRKSMINVNET